MPEQEIITIDRELEYLIPEYLAGKRDDVETIRRALQLGDIESIRTLGHNMKGTGGGYGFEAITVIGGRLEEAAKCGDAGAIERHAGELADYLGRVEIRYI